MKKVLIVAELSANHNGSLETAIETIKAAKRAGADAIKLQTYTADTMTIRCDKQDFLIDGNTLWDGQTFHNLYQTAYTPWEWHKTLFDTAREEGLLCFSTPFDITSVDFLEELGNPIYKIASFEITDIGLIEYIASKQKPVIISTGIAEYEDIKLAVETIRKTGNNDITVLKCTSSYPAPIEDANLCMISKLKQDFDVKVGLSDHTIGFMAPVVATSLGAELIEKHFIIDRSIGGPDAEFSMNEMEFKEMVEAVRMAEKSLGTVSYDLTAKQQNGKMFSRSLYIVEDLQKGEVVSEAHIRSIRPGYSLHPKYLPVLIGKKALKDFTKGDRISLSDFE